MKNSGNGNYYNTASLKKSLIHFFLGKSLGGAIGVCWLLLLIRIIPTSDYGVYVGFVAYLELFVLFSNVGLSPVSERYIPVFRTSEKYFELRKSIVWLVSLRIFSVLIFLLGSLAFFDLLAELFGFSIFVNAFLCFQVVIFFESIARFIETIFDSLLQQGKSQVSLTARTAVRLILVYLVSSGQDEFGLMDLIVIEAISFAFGFFVTLLLLFRLYADLPKEESGVLDFKSMIEFSLPIYGSHLVASFVGINTIKILVLKTVGSEASAIFGFCSSIVLMLQRYLPSFLLAGMVRPIIVSSVVNAGGLSKLRTLISIIFKINGLIVGSFFAICLVLGDYVIDIISGGVFNFGGSYLSVFLIYLMTQTLRTIYGYVAMAKNLSRELLFAQLMAVVILACGVVGSQELGLIAYCWALVVIDLFWIWYVNRGIRRSTAPLFYAWIGVGKVVFIIVAAVLTLFVFKYFFIESLPIAEYCLYSAAIVCFEFLLLAAILRPFSGDERVLINKLLPKPIFIF